MLRTHFEKCFIVGSIPAGLDGVISESSPPVAILLNNFLKFINMEISYILFVIRDTSKNVAMPDKHDFKNI